MKERDGLLRDSARLAVLREQLIVPANAILAYGQLLQNEVRSDTREAGYVTRIVTAARQAVERLTEAGPDLAAAADPSLLRRLRHDLRSPLGAVKGFAELLLADGAPLPRAELERILERVGTILARLDGLVAGECHEPQAADLAAALAATAGALPEPATSPGRILVVDDDEHNRALLADILILAGHTVDTAASAAAALERLAASPCDIVLLDLLMPGMNGLELLLAIRAQPDFAELPALVLSGVDHAEMTGRCLAAGAHDFVRKPFDTAILRARVAAALERSRLRQRERLYLDRLDAEKRRTEALLDNILPQAVSARLASGERTIADRIDPVTVVFADVVGFTKIATRLSPVRLIADLDRLVSAFDELAAELGVEKIKTVGDAYLAVAGAPMPRPDHADAAAELALRMAETSAALAPHLGADYRLRIGLHSGPILAGVIGRRKFSYDVWGDTVNVAARLQQQSAPASITISATTAAALASSYRAEPLGEADLRGRGVFATFRLTRAR
ncbi:MAG: adenylate/guanylate cyclase domain-containing protein [Geminicoccaceae bacterium]